MTGIDATGCFFLNLLLNNITQQTNLARSALNAALRHGVKG